MVYQQNLQPSWRRESCCFVWFSSDFETPFATFEVSIWACQRRGAVHGCCFQCWTGCNLKTKTSKFVFSLSKVHDVHGFSFQVTNCGDYDYIRLYYILVPKTSKKQHQRFKSQSQGQGAQITYIVKVWYWICSFGPRGLWNWLQCIRVWGPFLPLWCSRKQPLVILSKAPVIVRLWWLEISNWISLQVMSNEGAISLNGSSIRVWI